MGNVKGKPTYWNRFLGKVLRMVKLIGLSTFFKMVSFTDLQWDELKSVTNTLHDQTLTCKGIHNIDFFTRYIYLNVNSLLLARDFQFRVWIFFSRLFVFIMIFVLNFKYYKYMVVHMFIHFCGFMMSQFHCR